MMPRVSLTVKALGVIVLERLRLCSEQVRDAKVSQSPWERDARLMDALTILDTIERILLGAVAPEGERYE